MEDMKDAYVYIRVSTEEQAKHGYSIDGQKKICEDFARQSGYRIVKFFIDEGLSAKDLNRPQAMKMLSECTKSTSKDVCAIIVWKLDRLSRFNTDYHGTIMPILRKTGMQILSATEANIDTPEGNYVRNIVMCTAEFELELGRMRTKMNMKAKAEKGYFPSKAPYGYKNVTREDGTKVIVINDKEAFFVKRMFNLYTTGQYSLDRLNNELFESGFCQPSGKKYPASKVGNILHNVVYIGKFVWDKTIYEGKHAPIIPTHIYHQVQGMFPDTKDRKTHKDVYPYTGLIRCAYDNGYLTAETQKGAHNSGVYIYYYCAKNSQGCGKKTHKPQAFFDKYFESLMGDLYIPPDMAQDMMKEAKKIYEEFQDHKYNTVEHLQSKIKQIDARIKKSYMDKLDGNLPAGMTDEQWNTMQREWNAEKDHYTDCLKESDNSAQVIHLRLDLLLKTCENLPLIFKSGTVQEKKQLLRLITRTLTFDGETLTVELKPAFEELRILAQNRKWGG